MVIGLVDGAGTEGATGGSVGGTWVVAAACAAIGPARLAVPTGWARLRGLLLRDLLLRGRCGC